MSKFDGSEDDWVSNWDGSQGNSKYQDSFATQAEHIYRLGATDAEAAEFFKVSTGTIHSWARRYPAFAAALRTGKDEPDERVVRSLYQRAIGYVVETGKVVMVDGKPEFFKYREHVQPDTTACIFWLKNRRPQEWREKSEVFFKHDAGAMSDDELAKIIEGELGPKKLQIKSN